MSTRRGTSHPPWNRSWSGTSHPQQVDHGGRLSRRTGETRDHSADRTGDAARTRNLRQPTLGHKRVLSGDCALKRLEIEAVNVAEDPRPERWRVGRKSRRAELPEDLHQLAIVEELPDDLRHVHHHLTGHTCSRVDKSRPAERAVDASEPAGDARREASCATERLANLRDEEASAVRSVRLALV
eukprot:CAMPEP_0202791522 /NCGR_PEP_ID=MMETSP1388-20130828/81711_1 /ASSEMBLY_ACC=CAM_ASM_000864 /TAXON_ID=37098 /ORGANISM="Isochrysis sp, Strain CCMP1244" /LENGTH=183 /DNA_ID=CAMNT_0049461287 /DNA_START=386 /DNA_END=933 /DNA_ORIENTATION=-